MIKKRIFNGLKIVVIILLMMMISFLILMHWRSDVIVRKAVGMIQNQLEDSLRYDDISLEWLRYFPSAALQMDGLQLGPAESPLMQGGTVDVVLRLFPLLNEKIIINKLMIANSHINITYYKGRWSYDLFKKQDLPPKVDNADITGDDDSTKWEALVKQINLENTVIFYDDSEGLQFSLDVEQGKIKGKLTGDLFDADLNMKALLNNLKMKDYKQGQPFAFDMSGKYKYDVKSGSQELKNWRIQNEGLDLEVAGNIKKEGDDQWVDIQATWMDGNPQFMKAWIPVKNIKHWNDYTFSGKSGGKLNIKGISSKNETPHITFSSELENGSIRFPGEGGQLKNMTLDLAYDNGESKGKNNSYFRANLRNGSFQGNTLKADMRVDNLEQPVMNLEMSGSLPAGILNLFMDSSSIEFKEGAFEIDHYRMQRLSLKTFSTKTFIEKSDTKLKADHLRLNFYGDEIEINQGDMRLDDAGNMKLQFDAFTWNNATGENIEGELVFGGDKVDFKLDGHHSKGEIHSEGSIAGLGGKPVMTADWKVKGIEMKELLTSFDNFDQTFITSEHLNGKADIWTHTMIPYDADGNIMVRDIEVRAAIEIKDGKLKDLKTLEDFSKYVHLDDLREIRFNQFRNYMKIENGKVYLPVVFIQSSAMNLSINGVHSFDQEILYNLKINAGQVAANKLKKFDPLKKLKEARKSGWINLYFILSGTVDDVKYEQDQKQVISSFEQSSQLKESLRSYLVDRFGHDVYWLEPNEWEDIPEYK